MQVSFDLCQYAPRYTHGILALGATSNHNCYEFGIA
jgi:hypothetical protein